jgi:uncharacterized protein (TIGR03066 family)
MRTKPFICLLALTLIFASGCGSAKPKDLIIGKWKPVTSEKPAIALTVEFKTDGTVILGLDDKVDYKGKYRFVGADQGAIELDAGTGQKEKSRVEVTKDTLKMINENGKYDTFVRVK